MGSYAQDLSEEEGRQVEDMSAKLEKLKKSLMSMQKESGTESKEIQNKIVPRTTRQNQPTTSPPYLPLSRSRNHRFHQDIFQPLAPARIFKKNRGLVRYLGHLHQNLLKIRLPQTRLIKAYRT